MDKLLNFVITHGNLNLVALSDLLSMLEPGIAKRFVTAAFGIENYTLPADCPKVAEKGDKVYTFEYYNYLKDKLKATYPCKEKRYYPNAEEAAKKSWDYSCKPKEGYEYETIIDKIGYNYFSLKEWLDLVKYNKDN